MFLSFIENQMKKLLLGITWSIVKGFLLKGSVASLKRCVVMDLRSMEIRDSGKITGSSIISYISGSKKNQFKRYIISYD